MSNAKNRPHAPDIIDLEPTTQHDVSALQDLATTLRAAPPKNETQLFGLLRVELELVEAQYLEDEQDFEASLEMGNDDYIASAVDLAPLRRALEWLETYERDRRAYIGKAEQRLDREAKELIDAVNSATDWRAAATRYVEVRKRRSEIRVLRGGRDGR